MNEYLAHSAKNGFLPQTYSDHIQGVYDRAIQYAKNAEKYSQKCKTELTTVVQHSALLHDLGKLEDENQSVLRMKNHAQHHLPINHVDAGSLYLKAKEKLYAALIVYSHHKGLPDMEAEFTRENNIFRDSREVVRNHVDATVDELVRRHSALFPIEDQTAEHPYNGDQGVFFRMALSCLADADHTDTAAAYGQAAEHKQLLKLRARERLAALDRYVSELGGDDKRSNLRREMYAACRNTEVQCNFSICDSPVGSGKTTAVMAHLLRQAIKRNARHIFVVLPYTTIIKQSVDVYRKALMLPGEDPEEVVAELHSRADFQDYNTRYLTSLWRAPIIVTTAVAFFETMASNLPSSLRRFHELPGSIIFIDEAHNALPIKLLPLAWHWMNVLAEEWMCYWVLASGSLVRYWQLDRLSKIQMACPKMDSLVPKGLKGKLMEYEHDRITFRFREKPISRQHLIEWVHNSPGPRLLILNTVQSSAVIASDLSERYGRLSVEHLSTALTPEDRGKIIDRVNQRLNDPEDDNWTLVATSCVEAGLDFSFRTGFREISSLLSLLQAAGRINRHGSLSHAIIWSFMLQDDSMLSKNPQANVSAAVLRDYFINHIEISPWLSTKSMNDEIVRDDTCVAKIRYLSEQEKYMQFQCIAKEFRVIDDDTVTAIVDPEFAKDISCAKGDWRQLLQKSIPIRRSKIDSWKLKELTSGIYKWTLAYDDFLGYMRGVLDCATHSNALKKD